MQIDPVQAAIERAAAKYSKEEWSSSLHSSRRTAAIYAELRKLDAEAIAGSPQPAAGPPAPTPQ